MYIVIIIIIITIIFITFMQGIYNYMPETNHISRVYSVAAILYLQFVLHVILFRLLNIFYTFTFVLPIESVQRAIRLFFVVPWFHLLLLLVYYASERIQIYFQSGF